MASSLDVLVTGSAGRIGQAVVRELKARGHFVRGFDLGPTPGADESITASITDGDAVRRAAEGARPSSTSPPRPTTTISLRSCCRITSSASTTSWRRRGWPARGGVVLASSGQVVWHQRFTGPLPITRRRPADAARLVRGDEAVPGGGRPGLAPRPTASASSPPGWVVPADARTRRRAGRHRLGAGRLPQSRRRRPLLRAGRRGAGRLPLRRRVRVQPAGARANSTTTAPAKERVGYEPRDKWPEGVEDLMSGERAASAP